MTSSGCQQWMQIIALCVCEWEICLLHKIWASSAFCVKADGIRKLKLLQQTSSEVGVIVLVKGSVELFCSEHRQMDNVWTV